MNTAYQLGKDIQSILDKLDRLGGNTSPCASSCSFPVSGFMGNNPNFPDTLAIEIQSGGVPVPANQAADMVIVNNSGKPAAITAGQAALSLPSGGMGGINQTGPSITIETALYSYFDPCYPKPPNPDTICIVTSTRAVLVPAKTFDPRGDARPANDPYKFASDGTIT